MVWYLSAQQAMAITPSPHLYCSKFSFHLPYWDLRFRVHILLICLFLKPGT